MQYPRRRFPPARRTQNRQLQGYRSPRGAGSMRSHDPDATIRLTRTALVICLSSVVAAPATAQAQEATASAQSSSAARPAASARVLLTPADYGRFESLAATALSSDGRWLAYGIRTVDEKDELRLRPLDQDTTRVFAWGTGPTFSPDNKWLTWTIGVSTEERQRLERAREPVRTGVGLLDLATGVEKKFD